MSLQVVTTINEKILTLKVTGEYSIAEMLKLVDLVRTECDNRDLAMALVDCREMIGTMTEAERFAGGQRVAEILGSDIKAALLMPQGQVTKLGEMTAVNRGARFLVTDSEDEARDWLTSE
ncbi:MAG TPA: hypothetical protein PKA82_16155 [Pyrinomonadaceae bacterium]|nr:hypothetical protein [Pyrinomonadaceae bacterium]